jgi:Lantibiotic dehydratase, N terminus
VSGEAEHRFRLGETPWSIWRIALLRSTGFPVAGLDRLAGTRCAAVADEHLAGRAGAEAFQAALAETLAASSEEVNRIAADERLREAVTWQNPAAVTLLDSLQRSGPPAPRNKKRRYREHQLARLWQRYCAKSETIGFFGPGLWIAIDEHEPDLRAVPGPDVLARRQVFLEPWALTTYAATLAEDPEIRRWLPVAPVAHFVLEGACLRRPGLPPQTLSEDQAALVARADGRRPAARIVADLAAAPGALDEAGWYAVLDDLVRRKLVTWGPNLPVGPHTGELLAERIAAIGDEGARGRAAGGLARLERARDAVGAAAGDPAALACALEALDAEFVALTGREPRRRAGKTYAGRGLCYEDTARGLEVVVGRRLVDDITPALTVALRASRWVTSEVARVYEDALGELFDRLRGGAAQVCLSDLWDPALATFWGPRRKPIDGVLDDLAAAWRRLFDLPSLAPGSRRLDVASAALAPLVDEVFAAERPGWSLARIHSPDVHVCAGSAEAVNRGEYLVVLGETHIAYSTLTDRWCTWSLPDPKRNLETAIEDYGQRRLVPLLPVVFSRDAGRVVQIEDAASDVHLGYARAAWVEAERLVPIASVPVRREGGRVVGVMRDGEAVPLIEFFAAFLSMLAVNALREVSDAPHTPRVTIDRVVLFRETWRLTVADLGELMALGGEAEQYLAARRLVARLGLPDRCFVKIATETKPVYVDFTSPLYITSLSTMLRAAREAKGGEAEVRITEMLPTPDQTWVPDAEGGRYFGEIRLHLVDSAPASTQLSS